MGEVDEVGEVGDQGGDIGFIRNAIHPATLPPSHPATPFLRCRQFLDKIPEVVNVR
jgi:hypothetical protein